MLPQTPVFFLAAVSIAQTFLVICTTVRILLSTIAWTWETPLRIRRCRPCHHRLWLRRSLLVREMASLTKYSWGMTQAYLAVRARNSRERSGYVNASLWFSSASQSGPLTDCQRNTLKTPLLRWMTASCLPSLAATPNKLKMPVLKMRQPSVIHLTSTNRLTNSLNQILTSPQK